MLLSPIVEVAVDASTAGGGPSAEDLERMNEALRAWYVSFSDLGRQFAAHLGIHSSDATALMQITGAEDRGAPLTQSQLARQIGLTTPATSSLLNRLENAGHIERHRTTPDRRVVTLRSTQAMHDEVHAFFRDVGADMDDVSAAHPAALVTALTELVTEMTRVMDRHLAASTGARPAQSDSTT